MPASARNANSEVPPRFSEAAALQNAGLHKIYQDLFFRRVSLK
jgi:hypothetical protein